MAKAKQTTHLARDWNKRKATGQVAACGLQRPRRWTADAPAVTCGVCKTTIRMADAEQAHMRRKGRAA